MKTFIFIIATIFGLLACSTAPQTSQNDPVRRVSQSEFKEAMKENASYQLIDVRTPEEYAIMHLDNAQNIDFYGADFSKNIQKLDKNKLTLIYCQAGGRSSEALVQMKSLGFKNVLELEGGFSNWKR